jgi:signal transduction histidine kinase
MLTFVIVITLLAVITWSYCGHKKKRWLLQQTMAEKMKSQERIMHRVSKEMHTNFTQVASLINISLSEILHLGPGVAEKNIIETKILARQLLADMNAFSRSLDTEHVNTLGLASALEEEFYRVAANTSKAVFFCEGEEYRIHPDHEVALFRLCQDLLYYVCHTVKSESVRLMLNYEPWCFEIGILYIGSDNVTPETAWVKDLRQRAAFIKAEFNTRIQARSRMYFYCKIDNPIYTKV